MLYRRVFIQIVVKSSKVTNFVVRTYSDGRLSVKISVEVVYGELIGWHALWPYNWVDYNR